jgi:hypothetical protein
LGGKNREEEEEKKKKKWQRRRRVKKALVLVTDFFFFFFSYLFMPPKLAGMTETRRNGPKFFPRWNKGVFRSGLHTGTRFFG